MINSMGIIPRIFFIVYFAILSPFLKVKGLYMIYNPLTAPPECDHSMYMLLDFPVLNIPIVVKLRVAKFRTFYNLIALQQEDWLIVKRKFE